ncbi:MAG: diaminopimelate decarboxylase, partial [Bdellovibrionales bacterium]|nr:diaminopimelate decarboxylase [Bdellovibrionales bacterium]
MHDYTDFLKDYSSPVYIYDLDGLKKRAEFFKSHMPKNGEAHFAMKANNNPHVLKVLKDLGYGADVVSLGELKLAIESGFSPEKIVFSGVGKSIKEIKGALEAQISQINVESLAELERIVEVAKEMKAVARVAFRMNPDVDADTHPYIRTGFRDNKFGIDFSESSALLSIIKKNKAAVELCGLTLHIGSQLREVAPFQAAIEKTLELYKSIQSSGLALSTFDVGGGVGIDYSSGEIEKDNELIVSYMSTVKGLLEDKVERVYFEPGRILTARFGVLLTEIQYIKRTPHKNFIIVDAGMHLLMRPSLYQAYHRIEPAVKSESPNEVFDVVGPICES